MRIHIPRHTPVVTHPKLIPAAVRKKNYICDHVLEWVIYMRGVMLFSVGTMSLNERFVVIDS